MADKQLQSGNALFEAFVEQIKQVLEHLYDFAFLQQHPLARRYDGATDGSAKTAGRQLRYELINAIESLKPLADSNFRAPDARLYNILHLIYVENLTMQETAAELGLSERQAYRDLKRGQESIAAIVWDKHESTSLPPTPEFSLQTEMERLRVRYVPMDIAATFRQAQSAVTRLAQQQGIEIIVSSDADSLPLSTDPALAHQTLVSLLSYAIQQAQPGTLHATFEQQPDALILTLAYPAKPNTAPVAESAFSTLAGRLRWQVYSTDQLIELRMTSGSTAILVIDDNEGWVSLIERFLEGMDCVVASISATQASLEHISDLMPAVIILDVMMPDRDGWEILQRLRAQPATAHIPVIVCTVFNDAQLAYSLGASAFLPKPTDRDRLLQTLHELHII